MDLVLEDIDVVYGRGRDRVHAVRGLSLKVAQAETVAVVGESGSGKSSLGRVAAGLQTPSTGQVCWRSTAVGEKADKSSGGTARQTQMVFQHPHQSLDPTWKIGRSITEPLRNQQGSSKQQQAAEAADWMSRIGLDQSLLERYPREVSGGQAQRIAVARALIGRPQVVVLDEPTASLDHTVRGRMLELLARLQDESRVGYLMITHDLASVRTIADWVVVMYRGAAVEEGSTENVLNSPAHPYTRALIDAVPPADPRIAWKWLAADRRASGASLDALAVSCPAGSEPCAEHGPGLHALGPRHRVACIDSATVPATGKDSQ